MSVSVFGHRDGRSWSRLTTGVAALASGATFAGLAISIAPPAQAAGPDEETAAVSAFARKLATDFFPQMASSSSVSQQLPTLATTPAASVGLRTALADALAGGGQLGDLAKQETLAKAASYVLGRNDTDASDGVTWDFTGTSASAHALTLAFTRVVTSRAGLDVRNQDSTFALSSGDGIDVTGTLKGSLTFTYDSATKLAALTSPSLSIRTVGDLPENRKVPAGLGILGVQVVGAAGTADYRLDSTVATAWANPDNDPAGSLAFDNPATDASDDGELSAQGAGTGIVTPTRAGTVGGHLVATPRPSDLVSDLPSIGATVDVTGSGASFETPSVTTDVDKAAEPFLTMTPRDLAASLSQAASAVLGMQNAKDGQLPLMRGSMANAIDAVGGIKAFLADQVVDPDTNDETPGQPKFASLQDMLAAFATADYKKTGWSIDVLTDGADAATWDADKLKVNFTIRAERDQSGLELDILGAPLSGTGTYTKDTVSSGGIDLFTSEDKKGDRLIGRKVTAGGSYGTIESVTQHAVKLTSQGWVNGQPAPGTIFTIEAADPKTGAPAFGDALKKATGIANANAEVSTATVSPKVSLTLPIVLDLRAPLTYVEGGKTIGDCDPDPAKTAPCPFKQVDKDTGLGRVITSLPLAADRVMLRQKSGRDLLVADATIHSPVQVNATSGFLGLSLTGSVDMARPDEGHTQTLTLSNDGDIAMPAFVEAVRKQADGTGPAAFTQVLAGTVKADVDVAVDGTKDAFAPGVSTTKLTLTGDVADLANGIDYTPKVIKDDVTVTPQDKERADLLKALNIEEDNPTSLFGGVNEAFKAAGSDLATMTGGGLDTPIPLVGSSVSQLIGAGASGGDGVVYGDVAAQDKVPAVGGTPEIPAVPAKTTLKDPKQSFSAAFIGRQVVVGSTTATIVDAAGDTLTLLPQLPTTPVKGTPYLVENELLGAVHALTALTPDTLQETLGIAQASLGNGSTIDFGLVDANGATDGGAQLRLDLVWKRSYSVSQPVSIDLGDQEFFGASAGGELKLDATGTVKLRLFLPLTATAMEHPVDNTLVDQSFSSIDFGASVGTDDAHIGGNLGPISLDLGTTAAPGKIHAGFGVQVTGNTADEKPGIASFFSTAPKVSITNGTSGCAVKVVLCGRFPVFVSGVQPEGDDLTVTTTLGAGDSLSTLFATPATKVALPSGLQKILDGEGFAFDSLAEGLKQYLFYTETALRTASNDGEMPVVGKDLQAGADFMGKARKGLSDFIALNGDPSTVEGATTLLTTTLAEKLGVVVDGSKGITLGFTCSRTLEPPTGKPTGTPQGAISGDAATYFYKVVSVYKDAKGVEHDSVPSAASDAVINGATIGTKYNKVEWTKVDIASGYRVLRATTATGTYGLVGSVTSGSTLSYDDRTPTPSTYPAATKAYSRINGGTCAPSTPVTQIEGVTLDLELGQGKVTDAGCENDVVAGKEGPLGKCLGGELPIDLGIPGLSLKTGDGGAVKGTVGWNLSLKVGMSRNQGFYVETGAPGSLPEFRVGASLGLTPVGDDKTPDLTAQLAIIKVNVEKNKNEKTGTLLPEFVGKFAIDMKDDQKDSDTLLTLGEMTRLRVKDLITVSVNANVDVNWHLAASADAALPGVSTDFRMKWAWGASTSPTPSNTQGLTVAFNKVTLDAGKFFEDALGPYLKQIVDATKPLQPIIDTIFTPMPVISDLSKAAGGDEITIATLAEKFSTVAGGPRIKPFLEAIRTIKTMLANVKCTGASCGYEIGSFTLKSDRVARTGVTAGNSTTMIATKSPVDDEATRAAALAKKDQGGQLSQGGKSKLDSLREVISFPVLEDPTILFDLISGGDIELVGFDSGPLTLGFQFQKSFGPIYAPPPVMMVVGGGASVSLRIAAGFDTYGIRRAIETGDGAQVLDSLYFKTVDKLGNPIPVVQFTGYLEAGASVSIGILEVGVVGGIKLTVGFYWNDPNNDGKFRLFEFGAAVANNPICLFNVGGELSLYIKVFVTIGFSPFSVSFDFTLVNLKLLDFNLKPNCTPPPPRLGGTTGSVLYVFAGSLGNNGERGDPLWNNGGDKDETWVIRQVPGYEETVDGATVTHDPSVDVRGLGITESFPDTAEHPIRTVVVDGRGYGGKLTITFSGGEAPKASEDKTKDDKPTSFTKDAVVFGGDKADNIRTGEGSSWVDGGAGDDVITTLDRQDLSTPADSVSSHVAGGAGGDVITVGNGEDTVTGDGSLGRSTGDQSVDLAPELKGTAALKATVLATGLSDPADKFAALIDGAADGNDQIAAGLGRVTLSGNGGDDVIGTANDNSLAESSGIKAGTPGGSEATEALYRAHQSTIVGGRGEDVLKSGSADDFLYTGKKADIGESDPGEGDESSDKRNTVDSGAGSDHVYGSNAKDFVTTHSTKDQKTVVYGGGADDVITGGQGSDELYGGPDDDYLVASPATVSEKGTAKDVLGTVFRTVGVLPGASTSPKLLVGGTGSDRIYGNDGPSTIYGDTTTDTCEEQSNPVSGQPKETENTEDAADLVLGGNGKDTINAGGAADWVYAAGSGDLVCGNMGGDHLYAGDGDDLVYGGSGVDEAYGEAGDDQVYGNDDGDFLYGSTGKDRLQGNKAADWVDGGADDDVILGGTSKAGVADGSDTLLGSGGADLVVGDDAQSDVRTAAPYPTDLDTPGSSAGAGDYIVGGDQGDSIYGGLGDDRAWGGDGDDYAEGNTGSDTVRGEAGDDDLIGGSSELVDATEQGRSDVGDFLYGGAGQDVVTGDNAVITRQAGVHPVMYGHGLTTTRAVDLRDEGVTSAAGVFGNDYIQGDGEADIVFAQRGDDEVVLGDGADYGEGGPGVDKVNGNVGDDDIVGGSYTPASGLVTDATVVGQPDSGDLLAGDAGEDVVLGDNGSLTRPEPAVAGAKPALMALVNAQTGALTANRVATQRLIAPYDLGDTPTGGTSAADTITGDADDDVLLGQGGNDKVSGGTQDDYAEGGQGSDLVLGDDGDDDVLGGSSASTTSNAAGAIGQPDLGDNVYGGAGSDLAVGDNALLQRSADGAARDWRTDRADATQTAKVPGRTITEYDLNGTVTDKGTANTTHSAQDSLSGQSGVDVILGQDGDDRISGGGDDDYAEGQGGADTIRGDLPLTAAQVVDLPADSTWVAKPAVDSSAFAAGQDDLLGGWSRTAYRDGDDTINGDGDDDFVLGDNGSVTRVVGSDFKEKVYDLRYGTTGTASRSGHAKVRVAGGGEKSTRFCPTTGTTATSTCEVAGAFGKDSLFGDAGQDVVYGQDGNDLVRGGADDDDLYGELGDDTLFGEDGEDAILGDRGGVQDRYENGSRSRTTSTNQPPAETFVSRRANSVSREADLFHDVDGTDFVGGATSTKMPLDGIAFGGADRIRGGNGADTIHGGAGDDLANGDAGGDAVLGDGGKDVLWGGVGNPLCPRTDTTCQAGRGTNGEFIDHLAGGKGEDVIDWYPRGVYGDGSGKGASTCSPTPAQVTTKGATTDPCSWFTMTGRDNDTAVLSSTDDNQHHQGVDWVYGGWDRDVMQGDQAANGPNPGDRMIDWNGVYNYWSHCNAAYGGWNDLRSPSPAIEGFLREWAVGLGVGRPGTSAATADVVTPGTSAYEELALVYNPDQKDHGTGSAYPTTPGHFDDPGACGTY